MMMCRSRLLSLSALPLAWALALLSGCSEPSDPVVTDEPDLAPPLTAGCLDEPLPLQNPRSFTLGDTFYLPGLRGTDGCPREVEWEIATAPAGSQSAVHGQGAPQPRFTPDVAGRYVLRARGLADSETTLTVVARAPAERFRNHYLTPLFGLARVGDEVWVSNGAAYTVSRLGRAGTTWQKRGEIPVGAWPAALAFHPSWKAVAVAQRGADSIGFIERERGVLSDALWVGDEPTGLAVSPDGGTLYVSLATERAVALVDVASRTVKRRFSVGFDPRALALSADGLRLFVASYRSANLQNGPTGSRKAEDDQDVWVVRTDTGAIEKTVLSVAADLRALALSSDGKELYVAATDGDTIPPQTDPMARSFVHQAVVIGADPTAADYGKVLRRADLSRQASAAGQPFVNPGGVAAVGDTLWLSSEASDQLVALDRASLAEKQRVAVCPGGGPRHVLPLGDGGLAVHCFQSFAVVFVGADGKVAETVRATDDPRPPAVALGERVFNRPGAVHAANHACASCHIETQNDGMVWRFGPMIWHNVRPLQLLDATTPIEWGAYVSSTDNFGFQGPSSIVGRPATNDEAAGLTAFLGSLLGAPRATAHTRPDGSYTEAGRRGQALFEKKLGCAGCHQPPLYTSRRTIAAGKSGEAADVPSLLGVYRHGVYLVNGQARSLEAVVDAALGYVKAQASDGERADLIEFLRQLTPKGAPPLGIWPDIDSAEGVYPDVQPWVGFAEPVDSSLPGRSAVEEAAAHLSLVAMDGGPGVPVAGDVKLDGGRLRFVPKQPLGAGQRYTFRVSAGLRFLSGGVLEGDRTSEFAVARPATARLEGGLKLRVYLPPMGPPPAPPPPPIELPVEVVGAVPGGLQLKLTLSPGPVVQEQILWARLDGDTFLMQPFSLPTSRAIADAASVKGAVKTKDPVTGRATLIEGTLRLGAPGLSVPGLRFELVPR
jgi:hypothetical protein